MSHSALATSRYASPSPNFEAKLSQARHTLALANTAQPVAFANSLGAEDMVIAHLIATDRLAIAGFVLDTGALHPQTVALIRTLQQQGHALSVVHPPAQAVIEFVSLHGPKAMYQSVALRKACCTLRKLEPLTRALSAQRAWVTGLRREQSSARADVPLQDDTEARTKFNPLANWTWGDVWHHIATHQLPYNPLHDDHFPSIGCQPCTRAITAGEDLRAGRWWWEQDGAQECGLHRPRPGLEQKIAQ